MAPSCESPTHPATCARKTPRASDQPEPRNALCRNGIYGNHALPACRLAVASQQFRRNTRTGHLAVDFTFGDLTMVDGRP